MSGALHSSPSLYVHAYTLQAPTPAIDPLSPAFIIEWQKVSHRGCTSSPTVMAKAWQQLPVL
jgi:hypothetical protein